MADEIDTRLAERTYFDATDTIRHYDKERTANHRLAFSVLALVTGLVSTGWPAAEQGVGLLVAFGLVSSVLFFLISAKYAALINRERSRAGVCRDILREKGHSAIFDIDERKKAARRSGTALTKLPLSALWSAFYLLFTLVFLVAAFSIR